MDDLSAKTLVPILPENIAVSDLSSAKPNHAKLGAEKLMPEEQRRRFIEAARAARASEDEAHFDAALKQIAKLKKATS